MHADLNVVFFLTIETLRVTSFLAIMVQIRLHTTKIVRKAFIFQKLLTFLKVFFYIIYKIN